jgi:hypothetical protein
VGQGGQVCGPEGGLIDYTFITKESVFYRGSMAGLHVPLPMLRRHPRGCLRTAGADAVRYSFIVVDLHHLLLAGLPAHLCENSTRYKRTLNFEGCGQAETTTCRQLPFEHTGNRCNFLREQPV